MNKYKRIAVLSLVVWFFVSPCAYAGGLPLIARGLGRVLFSVVEIPKNMIVHGTQAFPFGMVMGTLGGTVKAVTGTVAGAVDIAQGAAPYAKYAALAMAL